MRWPRQSSRAAELNAISEFLDSVGTGAATVILEGEAGIGKSTLWGAGLAAASDKGYLTMVSRPVASEVSLPFSALGDLLEGLPNEMTAVLPVPQRQALAVALMREEAEGVPPPPLAVALAFLGVLRASSESLPVLLAIDDLQWVDRSSATALSFALRRLDAEPVRLLATRRLGADPGDLWERDLGDERVTRQAVGPLDGDELDGVLRARTGVVLPRPMLGRLERMSGGNPFFAIEVVRALQRLGSWPGRGEPLPVPGSLRDLVRGRLDALPPAAREIVFRASALSRPTVEVVAALEPAGHDFATGLGQAVKAGVIELEESRIRFTHPLLSSVAYSEATGAVRRAVHRRLADVVEDQEEQARHFGLSTEGPDALVAARLEEAAARARARGAPDAAAELLERARAITPQEDLDGALRRALRASEHLLESGDARRARSILEEAVANAPSGPGRARALSGLAWTRGPEEGGWLATISLLEQALAGAGDDLVLSGEVELGLAWSHQMCGAVQEARRHAGEAVRLSERTGNPALKAQGLAGLAFLQAMLGEGIDHASMEQAVAQEHQGERMWAIFRPRWLHMVMREWTGDLAGARSIAESLRDEAAQTGDVHSLSTILTQLARVECRLGAWEDARRNSEEADRMALQAGQWQQRVFNLSTRAMVEAHRGEVPVSRRLVEEAMVALGVGRSPSLSRIAGFELRATLGFLELSRGDADAANRHLAPLVEDVEATGIREPGVFKFHADAIEAMIEIGEIEAARDLLERFERRGRSLGRVWALATGARCRALLSAATGDLEKALTSVRQALEYHRRLPEPFEQARTLLVLGVLQRRGKHRKKARESLGRALETFDEIGARLWSEKARIELGRIGGRTQGRWELTPTEFSVAQLASAGRTNKEIGAALYLSPKTVEANLTRVYRKLGIRSRTELARVGVDAGDTTLGPARRAPDQTVGNPPIPDA